MISSTEILIEWYNKGYDYATWGASRSYIPDFKDKYESDSWIIGFHDKKQGLINRFDDEYNS
jgi:hypothetical protein